MDADGEPGVDVAAERKCVERRNPGSLDSRGVYRGPRRRVTGKHTSVASSCLGVSRRVSAPNEFLYLGTLAPDGSMARHPPSC